MTASSPGSVKGVRRPEKALTVDRAGSVASATAEESITRAVMKPGAHHSSTPEVANHYNVGNEQGKRDQPPALTSCRIGDEGAH
jgi:hypothetical protein